uniref:Succinate dehydrogenase cytochrome b556 subunit n=1 Tax=Arcella intermedia TaxID=1963864 RepID=A0A6B2LRW5_9EUKA
MPAMTSIAFRATGAGLSLGLVAAAAPTIFFPAFPVVAVGFVKTIPLLHLAAKFILAFPIVYHLLGGLRHFYFDYASRGLETTEEVDNTCKIMIVATAVTVLLLTFVG